ncbi:hypothetical protein GCM10027169_35680 [Gordonia jinhuaensis]|uniref:MspA protein n=1 Tax=Gordonia jinhuaensis TaxID=1517702 RepID=A0A916T451_9ACTN|nr:MspA family porin [Gordonia jinhuaensis]GGB29776.1 hypothetical protein GCM10011489_17450 [Gordonia jinhuaensis]
MSVNVSMRRALVGATMVSGAVAIAFSTYGTAAADTFVKLPDGQQSGAGLTLTRTNEHVQVSPSLAANGAGRVAWVSGDVTLKAPKLKASPSGPANGPAGDTSGAASGPNSTGNTFPQFATVPGSGGVSTDGAAATLSVGYIVGCQVNISSLSAGGALGISATPSLTGTLSIPLTPGNVTFALLDAKDITKAGTYHINWDRTQIAVQGCGGYAQARSFAVVETTGNDHVKMTLLGKPFSIG